MPFFANPLDLDITFFYVILDCFSVSLIKGWPALLDALFTFYLTGNLFPFLFSVRYLKTAFFPL